MGDHVTFEGALVVEVELLEGLAGREPGGADADLAAVVLAGGDLAFEAGGEELLVGPALGAGSFGEPFDGLGQRRRLQARGTGRRCRSAGSWSWWPSADPGARS